MATSPGTVDIAGSVTIDVGGHSYAQPFSLPVGMDVKYDKATGSAVLTADTGEFTKRLAALKDWICAFPAELCNG